MIQTIRQLFNLSRGGKAPGVPAGRRIYAIGDIHGRDDLFEAMIEAIEADAASGPSSTVILLGDLVDRGPDSAAVVARARRWQQQREVRILSGNHEEMFLESFRRKDVLRHFLRFGGAETLLSYGIQPRARTKTEMAALQDLMSRAVPDEDLEFIRGFEEMIIIGGYAFVHAGIVPEVALKQQQGQDLRWIREPFLSYPGAHSHVIVHGHTIYDRAVIRPNRIGIDTGAFDSGRLTALVLEGTDRRLIETKVRDKKGGIRVRERAIEE
ncbi:MAG: metallophosphoesterase [Candidatus Andeanibacterium colombiense]|uniref:Metallophosphoesterase n=1 Tax=Candidatus Andeanibacterium colombiense TaxID=3121345 RepID=A0AAJ5X5C3_9SPHN|nr:MAG: metallophosphoesterase [Sphingomonadaceae bacterium]